MDSNCPTKFRPIQTLFCLGAVSIALTLLWLVPPSSGCACTSNAASPVVPGSTTTTTTTTTTAAPGACCPLLTQTLTPLLTFADGTLTFTYDNVNCPQNVVANCSQPNAQLNLNAAIVVNQNNFMVVGPFNVTFPGTCVNGQWQMGTPPLTVNDIECLLTNPTGK